MAADADSPIGVPVRANPFSAVVRALRGSFQLRGRSSRSEYWWFTAAASVAILAAAAAEARAGTSGAITLVVVLLLLPASISVTVRRLHDAGYTGAWFFVQYLPFIGIFWLLILVVQPSQRLSNQYGPGPDDLRSEPAAA